MPKSKKRSRRKSRTWLWKTISAIALLYLIGMVIFWKFGWNWWNESIPDSAQQAATVQIFFGNSEMDPDALDCGTVFPVSRTLTFVPSIARSTLSELLKGPSHEEASQGYYTSINEGARMLELDVSNGTARVDFDSRFVDGIAGSCQVEAIRAQIARTLSQFPSVSEVVITVEGEESEAFQP